MDIDNFIIGYTGRMVKKKRKLLSAQRCAKKLEFTVFLLTHPEKKGKI